MKIHFWVLAAVWTLGSRAWAADSKAPQDLAAYLDQVQIKLEHTAERANQPTSGGSNVVGLRGSKQEPLSKQLYWKGKNGNQPVSPDEVKAFRSAVDEAQAGKKDDAAINLRSFLDKYPKSPLRSDAEGMLQFLPSAATPLKP